MKKLTLYVLSTLLLYSTVSTCAKHKMHKQTRSKMHYKILYNVTKLAEGLLITYVPNLTNDDRDKLRPAMDEIARLDESIERLPKNSTKIKRLKRQISIIETQNHLKRLPQN